MCLFIYRFTYLFVYLFICLLIFCVCFLIIRKHVTSLSLIEYIVSLFSSIIFCDFWGKLCAIIYHEYTVKTNNLLKANFLFLAYSFLYSLSSLYLLTVLLCSQGSYDMILGRSQYDLVLYYKIIYLFVFISISLSMCFQACNTFSCNCLLYRKWREWKSPWVSAYSR